MEKEKRYTTKEAADYLGLCVQRVVQKTEKGHFPGACWCECTRSRLIPLSDLKSDKEKRK